MKRAAVILSLVLACASAAMGRTPDADAPSIPDDAPYAIVKIKIAYYDETARLYHIDGEYWYVLYAADDGQALPVRPEVFARIVHGAQSRQGWWYRLLNITSPVGIAWVALGLLGQVLFTGRMVVQWLVSEKAHRSVVPASFWWMSLIGATMLLVYFGWRKDIVGFLGQATGWAIYVRNLWLIYRGGGNGSDAKTAA